MPPKNADSSEVTSDELRKQLSEQTSMVEDAEPEVEVEAEEETTTEETESTEQTEEDEAEETEPEQEETVKKTETKPVKKETLHKLKVEGREEEWPLEKVYEFAQKGRFLEREQQRLKERERQLEDERRRAPTPPSIDPVKAKEELFKGLEENPFQTLGMLFNSFTEAREAQTKEQRKADREFEKSRFDADPDTWKLVKPIYENYREEGHSRDMAYVLAENDLLRESITKVKTVSVKVGQSKEKAKLAADIPSGTKKTKGQPRGIPSIEEARKMRSDDLAKAIRKAGGSL